MLLNDDNIRTLCDPDQLSRREILVLSNLGGARYLDIDDGQKPMIEPFSEAVSDGVISYGLDHAGYSLRLAPKVLFFKNTSGLPMNAKMFSDPEYRRKMFDEVENHQFVLQPGSYILGMTYEYLRIPKGLKGRCVGKSTYARCGVLINTTPLEPGWEGHLTLEIGNVSPCPAVIYAMEGIAQLEIEMLTAPPRVDYAAKGGKYQGQTEVTPARIK